MLPILPYGAVFQVIGLAARQFVSGSRLTLSKSFRQNEVLTAIPGSVRIFRLTL